MSWDVSGGGQPNGGGAQNGAVPTGGMGGPQGGVNTQGTPRRPVNQAQPNTFAGMQQQGMARPSPGQVQSQAAQNAQQAQQHANNMQQQQMQGQQQAQQPMPQQPQYDNASAGAAMGTYHPNQSAISAPLQQQVMAFLGDPTQGLNEAAQSNFDRQNAILGRQYGLDRNSLNENMAARGLDASTIAATRLGDLGARQAEAQANMGAQVQENLAGQRANALQSAISSAMGMQGQQNQQDQSAYSLNAGNANNVAQLKLAGAQMDQQNNQFGQRLSLDSQLGQGQLANQSRGIDLQGRSLDQSAAQFAQQMGFNYAGLQQSGNQFDRNLSNNQNQFGQTMAYNQGRDATQNHQWQQGFDQSGNQFDRNMANNQQQFGMNYANNVNQFNTNQGNWAKQFDQSQNQFNTSQGNWQNQFNQNQSNWQNTFNQNNSNNTTNNLMSLLQGMGYNNLPPGALDSIFKTLGVNSSSPGSAGGTNTGNSGSNGNSGYNGNSSNNGYGGNNSYGYYNQRAY